MDIQPIQRAILSVYDKRGLVDLARRLAEKGCHLLSTGGTGRALHEAGIDYEEVSHYTGSPEMLQGRVKTLHPKIHGGLLYKREDPAQAAEAAAHGLLPIDLVVVNLYPFEATVAKPDVTLAEATENIDIGGPTLIRASAKNFVSVAVVTDPADYALLVEELDRQGGTALLTRKKLAAKAFTLTSRYDRAITVYLSL